MRDVLQGLPSSLRGIIGNVTGYKLKADTGLVTWNCPPRCTPSWVPSTSLPSAPSWLTQAGPHPRPNRDHWADSSTPQFSFQRSWCVLDHACLWAKSQPHQRHCPQSKAPNAVFGSVFQDHFTPGLRLKVRYTHGYMDHLWDQLTHRFKRPRLQIHDQSQLAFQIAGHPWPADNLARGNSWSSADKELLSEKCLLQRTHPQESWTPRTWNFSVEFIISIGHHL